MKWTDFKLQDRVVACIGMALYALLAIACWANLLGVL